MSITYFTIFHSKIKMSKALDVYSWPTPNGHKIHIMVEELGVPYNAIPINITKGDQFEPKFLAINPNNKIPALVDNDVEGEPVKVFESGAILIYLAEKYGKFLPKSGKARYEVIEWVMWQMGGIGPMLGQVNHFKRYAPEKIEYAINRYANEGKRLIGVLEKQLGKSTYVAGEEYSIADMAILPWVRQFTFDNLELKVEDYPNYKRWHDLLNARPAVQRGLTILTEAAKDVKMDDNAKKILFGIQPANK